MKLQRISEETYDTKDVAARDKARDRSEEVRKQIQEEQRAFNRARFLVGGPIGFVTFFLGFFLRPVAVGTGLAFGGLCTLTSGCYSYWNDMGDALKFFSLLIVLITAVIIGLTRFARPAAE